MTKDAAEDPYKAQRRRFVLPCGECGSVERVHRLRRPEPCTLDTPMVPLCEIDAGIEERVWGDTRTPSWCSVPEQDSFTHPDTGDTLWVVLCPRCDGSGQVLGRYCYSCIGARFVLLDPKGVRRTARWWQTYQQNRTDGALTQTRRAENSPPAD